MGARRSPIKEVSAQSSGAQKVLFVGDVSHQLLAAHPDLPNGPGAIYAAFSDLGADLFEEADPDVVISPLMGGIFDAMELAELLDTLGFEGRYVVVAPPLPRPDIIRGDVSAAAPGLDIELRVTRPN